MYDWHTCMTGIHLCWHTYILAYIYVCVSLIYTGIHICMYVISLYWLTYDCLSYIYVCQSHLHSHTYYMSAIDLYCHTYVYACLTYILLYICVSQSYIYTGINKCMSVIYLYWPNICMVYICVCLPYT